MFNLHILSDTTLLWALCSSGILCGLITLTWLLAPMHAVGKYSKKYQCRKEPEGETGNTVSNYPKASVIVYSFTDDEYALKYIESLSNQNYPNYEIILVMDSSYEDGAGMAERYAHKYPDIYVTFIPSGSHNLSRRKLALTLGMKAAKGDIAVTTASNSAIPSENWLNDLMTPFINHKNTEVVLGYSHICYEDMNSIWRWRREFDDLLTDCQWLGYALLGMPYRGDGYNLAFKRELFFEHKGYSKSIYLHSGDDDLFISEISNGNNTEVVLQKSSILTTLWGRSTTRTWRERKEQYRFTSRWLRQTPFIRQGATSAMQWIVTILLCASVVFGAISAFYAESPDITMILPSAISAVALFAFWQIEIIIYRRAAKTMNATRLWWSIPVFWLWQPIGNMLFNLRHKRSSVKNFTWQRK